MRLLKNWMTVVVAQVLVLALFGAMQLGGPAMAQDASSGGGGGGGGVSTSAANSWTAAQTFDVTGTGSNALVVGQADRLDLGGGSWDHVLSDGSQVCIGQCTGAGGNGVLITGTATAGSMLVQTVATLRGNAYLQNDNGSDPVRVNDAQGLRLEPKALPTCASALEWAVVPDNTSGVSTSKRSKLCVCTSDGAGSPAYAWQNLATGTIGTTTTCGTE